MRVRTASKKRRELRRLARLVPATCQPARLRRARRRRQAHHRRADDGSQCRHGDLAHRLGNLTQTRHNSAFMRAPILTTGKRTISPARGDNVHSRCSRIDRFLVHHENHEAEEVERQLERSERPRRALRHGGYSGPPPGSRGKFVGHLGELVEQGPGAPDDVVRPVGLSRPRRR